MAQIYVAGPAEIHVSPGGPNSTLEFLGWSESGVNINIRGEWDDVPADIAGTRMPADVQFMGEQAFVTLDLKVWNNSTYAKIASRYNPTNTRGIIAPGGIGKLMVAEGAAYRLLVYSPYAATKPSMASFNSFNFFRAWLAGPDSFNPYGTKAAKIRTIFRAICYYDCNSGQWRLYNGDYSGKPSAC